MNKIALEIKGLLYSESQSGAYVLILGDKHSMRRLPIVIGNNEAQSIALGLEDMKSSRPLTHDLFKKFAETYGIDLMEVVITRFREGVFYAMLVCKQGDDITMIDARPSDAIALAVRFGCPIAAYESVMDEASIEMDEVKDLEGDPEQETTGTEEEDEGALGGSFDEFLSRHDTFENLTLEQLQKLLQMAIEEEDYQKAAELRDLINSKNP
ncbi:MAG: bifunctional nuclease family protein [Bacteroidales bacterium]|nr:bifunctional nuclease family protein [Bacteroidales bacterium]